MKLLYIANARFPTEKAHGIQIAKTCEAFAQHGHEVELILPKRFNTIHEDPFSFYGLSIKEKDKKFTISYVWAPSILLFTKIGFLVSSFIFGITSVWYVRKREGVLYSVDLDYFSFVFIPFLRRPYFFEIHSAKKNTWAHRRLFKHINGVIAINNNVKEALIDTFSILKNKILIYPNGVDLGARNPYILDQEKVSNARSQLSIREPAVVYTGSFQSWKGIETVIDAARNLPQINFYLIGGTLNELEVQSKDLPGNVIIHGPQRYGDMPAWQCSGNILLVTGTKKDIYSYNYTSPMKLFEYMGSGVPIVAARTRAIESVVSDNILFFYEPDNPMSLAQTIKYVLDHTHTEEIKQRVSHALEKAKEFSYAHRAKCIINFISSEFKYV